ncbi:putative GPALPP motifs-containing protein 1 [Rosellinia necatrix]|uniref:Putative GPALPP motifs-containing protein 1 n=1 Tax=Rosellinia necatrix TaxID=77044 RepID=A0A1W2TJ43_ROSNE|nr:putative GPALPP motifs-containing protein 1 [Rosellinia necatrix]
MVSVGPALPPHLAKRKRTPDDEPSPDSPPTKIRASENRQVNQDEIGLDSDSDSDDGYGPPAPNPTVRPAIGPTPPSATSTRANPPRKSANGVLDSENDRTAGPLAPRPTPNTSKRSIGPTLPSANQNEIALDSSDEDDNNGGPAPPGPKRVHGPAPPPAPLSERPPAPADSDSDSDDDDDYGPALPSSTSHQQRQARALEAAEAAAAAAASQAPKRDDWMLAPPSASGPRSAADPTKLKARRFNSGPRANANADGGSGEISSIWTETPEEKRKRLENAVLGRDTGASSRASGGGGARPRQPDTVAGEDAEARAARIKSFTEATRGRSLYEEHQAARAAAGNKGASSSSAKRGWVDEEEDDPSKRAFDKEKDMKLGGRINASQRRELLNKAADFGGRFAKGKYL